MLEAKVRHDRGRGPFSRREVEEAFLGLNSDVSTDGRKSVTRVIGDPEITRETFLRMVSSAREEILLLLPSAAAFHREEKIRVIDTLEVAAGRGVSVQVLSPTDPAIRASVSRINQRLTLGGRPMFELTESKDTRRQGTVTVIVVDRKSNLVIEQVRPSNLDFLRAIGSSTYSTSAPTVHAGIRFFERVKEETTLRRREAAVAERERRSRAQAQLLRDILVHDIRNYNQITRACAEALRYGASQAELDLVEAIIRATEGSTALLDKSAKLSKIVASGSPKLYPMDLQGSVVRALSLIAKANPDRPIALTSSIETDWVVMADDLLDEVFVNLISNAVRYTESRAVPLEITVEPIRKPVGDDSGRQWVVKITVTDHGRGIHDEVKQNVFTRYQSSGGGTGLGLSIVHALVVDRYGGSLEVSDRVRGDHSMGTRMSVTLKPFVGSRQTALLQKSPQAVFRKSEVETPSG